MSVIQLSVANVLLVLVLIVGSVGCENGTRNKRGAGINHRSGKKELVKTVSELKSAISSANPGDHIKLAPVDFNGSFQLLRDGQLNNKITIEGTSEGWRTTKITGGDVGMTIKANNWIVKGILFENCKNALVVSHVDRIELSDLVVSDTTEDAILIK